MNSRAVINVARTALREAGEVVWVNLINGIENPASRGKRRPAVLIKRLDSQWFTMGLTTNSRYASGASRMPIPNPNSVGLTGSGYLWSERMARISSFDIGDHIGWVDAELAEVIGDLAQLAPHVVSTLLATARAHHASP